MEEFADLRLFFRYANFPGCKLRLLFRIYDSRTEKRTCGNNFMAAYTEEVRYKHNEGKYDAGLDSNADSKVDTMQD